MKLMYGEYEFTKYLGPNTRVINFSGLKEGYYNLGLLPTYDLGAIDEYDFDIKYSQYLLSSGANFSALMTLLLILQKFQAVYMIIYDQPGFNMILESFLKFLQARYGITATSIKSKEDIEYAGETDFDSRYGILNYDKDYERMIWEQETARINMGGKPYSE